ncbi:unnamed protein product, partial [Rhizophagus irregularis]
MSQLRVLIISAIIAILAFAALSSSYVIKRDIADVRKQNAKDAQALQDKFETFNEDTECKPDEIACIKGNFAKCATVATEDGKLPGTSLVCTTKEDRDARFDQAEKELKTIIKQ